MPRAAAWAANSASNLGLMSSVMVMVAAPPVSIVNLSGSQKACGMQNRTSVGTAESALCPVPTGLMFQIQRQPVADSTDHWLLAANLGVRGQCQQREVLPIHVVHQVKHSRESRAGVQR